MVATISELMDQLEQLSPKDLGVLEHLNIDKLVFPEEIASELYVLPKEVYASIARLKNLSLVEETDPPSVEGSNAYIGEHQISLTKMGRKAQALTSGKFDEFLPPSPPSPRYKK